MFKDINLQDNDLENGYIYKLLVEKIENLEKQLKEVQTSINTAKDEMNISLNDYVSMVKSIQDRVTREEFNRHIEDTEIHLHKSKTLTNEEEDKKESYNYSENYRNMF